MGMDFELLKIVISGFTVERQCTLAISALLTGKDSPQEGPRLCICSIFGLLVHLSTKEVISANY